MLTVKKVKKSINAKSLFTFILKVKQKSGFHFYHFIHSLYVLTKSIKGSDLEGQCPTEKWTSLKLSMQALCSVRALSCVWSALVLMLTIFHLPKTKIFCSVSLITWKKACAITVCKGLFFNKKACQTKVFWTLYD